VWTVFVHVSTRLNKTGNHAIASVRKGDPQGTGQLHNKHVAAKKATLNELVCMGKRTP
jgi:hypothetical protein